MASTRGGIALDKGGGAAETADARSKAQKVVDALLTGNANTFEDAAKVAGYADKSAAWRAFERLMGSVESDLAGRYRDKHNAILDVTIMRTFRLWMDADDPDVIGKYALQLDRFLRRQAALNGADAPVKVEADITITTAVDAEIRDLAAQLGVNDPTPADDGADAP